MRNVHALHTASGLAFNGIVFAEVAMMKSSRIATALFFAVTIASGAYAASPDASFVQKASAAGMAEIELSQLAATNASSAEIKSFAQTMVTDHTSANEKLTSIAKGKGLTPAASPDSTSKAAIASLKEKTGAAFDKQYAAIMLKDHKAAVALFEKEATSGQDAELKSFANDTLPTLKHHLEMATSLAGK
jgi:putative membrane protein